MTNRVKLMLALAATITLGAAQQEAPPIQVDCTPGPYIVFFDPDSSAIKKDAAEILDIAVENQGSCGSVAVLAGHADTREKRGVSALRLKAVSNYLASRGVFVNPRNMLDFGARELRVKTPPNISERQNRRIELTYGPDNYVYPRRRQTK
ncbi:hypothetical protein OF829_13625 [Sphingomonas sp. LB-2]|uniref:OmpA family protein n=1 Tax=Sphingomonas caeni TaxID=2984949 RepID=UPI00222EDD24|nr:hypothetical protein [Sphingomonas caeni]MCW3848280.1 hypothetical protein [Sphingomonas caeni]